MKRILLSSILILSLLFGISSVSAGGFSYWNKNRLTGKTWYITAIDKKLYTETSKVTFTFNRVNAQICNNMSGKYTLKRNGEIKKWALTTTLMMCDETRMQAESMFMSATKLQWTKDRLTISTKTGTLTLSTKKPTVNSPLIGKWKITSYDGNTLPKDLFIEFKADKMFSTTICNNISGTYTLTGEKLSFTNIGSTKMACKDGVLTDLEYALQKMESMTLGKDGIMLTTTDKHTIILKKY